MSDRRRFNGRTPRGLPPSLRFWAKVDGGSYVDCWLWTGAILNTGYGAFYYEGRTCRAHRWAYEQMVGPVPDALQIDHLCRNRACVNPWHLEPVTALVNTRRGDGPTSRQQCPRGHCYDEVNTYNYRGHRQCRECQRAYHRVYKAMSPVQREARRALGLPIVDMPAALAADAARVGTVAA